MKIELRIARIVLHGSGLDARGAAALRAALVAELTAAFVNEPRPGPSRRRLSTPPVRLTTPQDPGALAKGVARALHAGMGRTR